MVNDALHALWEMSMDEEFRWEYMDTVMDDGFGWKVEEHMEIELITYMMI